MKEVYGIKDKKTVELIASNHVVANLEPSFRETVEILQFSDNTKSESLLQLIKSKMGTESCSIGMKTTVPFAATSKRNESDRLDKLENMVKTLTEPRKVTTGGHLRKSCYKLKTCNKCQKSRHNEKFCWENPNPTSSNPFWKSPIAELVKILSLYQKLITLYQS